MTAQLLLKAHDTSSRSWRHKSTQFFRCWFLVRVSCKSWTGFLWYQIPALIRTLFYSKPESGVRVTEMMTCDWSMIIVDVLRCRGVILYSAVICVFIQYFQPCLFSVPETFNPDARWTKNQHWKSAPGKRSGFVAAVSGAYMTGLKMRSWHRTCWCCDW